MNYKQMVLDIDELVNNDFIADMECVADLHDEPGEFSQEDAVMMARILSQVYSISHSVTCRACGSKYKE